MRIPGMAAITNLLVSLVRHRSLMMSVALRQLKQRFVETVGGVAWSLIQPLLLILTYWFVFSFGFKVQFGDGNVSFAAYFVAGLAVWLLVAESLGASATAIQQSPHLVKKIVFPVETLPVAAIAASAIVHLAHLLIVLAFLLIERGTVPWTILQLPYYLACTLAFVLGLALLISALNVFFRDVQKIVESVLGIWFWLTPIVWPLSLIDEAYHKYLKLNPVHYLVQGYRDSLIHGIPFWQRAEEALIFWAFCLAMVALGAWVFQRLRPEFAEVL